MKAGRGVQSVNVDFMVAGDWEQRWSGDSGKPGSLNLLKALRLVRVVFGAGVSRQFSSNESSLVATSADAITIDCNIYEPPGNFLKLVQILNLTAGRFCTMATNHYLQGLDTSGPCPTMQSAHSNTRMHQRLQAQHGGL